MRVKWSPTLTDALALNTLKRLETICRQIA